MRMNINDKTILVTGGNSGIGKSVVEKLLLEGARVFAVDVNTSWLELSKKVYPKQLNFYLSDLSKLDKIKSIFDAALSYGYIFDGMVHCAGLSPIMKIEDNDIDKMIITFNVNVLSFIELLKYFHRNEFSNDNASVVTMTSIATSVASYRQTVYSSSKAALEQVVKCAAKEFLDRKIRVNAVSAGAVETEMLVDLEKKSNGLREKFLKYYPLGLISPEEIAKTIVYLLSNDSKHIDGSIFRIDSAFFVNK